MRKIQRRRERRVLSRFAGGCILFGAATIFLAAGSAPAFAQTPTQGSGEDRVVLGDLYSRIQRANPRASAARSLAAAAAARVSGATRPPDPQLQFGFMNYSVPRLAPMATDTTHYTFKVPSGKAVTVNVRLIYRRAFYQLEQQKGWNDPDILMAHDTLQIP